MSGRTPDVSAGQVASEVAGARFAPRVDFEMKAQTLLNAFFCILLPLTARAEQEGRSPASVEGPSLVLKATLDDEAISPGTAKYLQRAITEANQRGAACVVIVLDTPGGLLTSTRQLTKRILASSTPVVVYVAPSGSRAASAGVFITLASHVAAMAPGTTVGAAHPVQLGSFPVGPQPGQSPQEKRGESAKQQEDQQDKENSSSAARSPSEEKIINDTVAWVRALAELRGRNAEWAVEAVKESVSITSEDAVEQGVVELLAEDMDELLTKLDGRTVSTPGGPVELATLDAEVEAVPIWWGERILTLIAQPNVAFLLMMFGFYGILFELYNPGWGVSGTLGVICIVLALFGLAVLPVNYLGLILIAIALALMVAEVFVTSYGALALAGAACLVLGGVMLVDSPGGFARVSLGVVLPVALATGAVSFLLVSGIVRSHSAPVQTGGEGLIGETGRVASNFTPRGDVFHGSVAVHGERWNAVSQQPLKSDEFCEISSRDGLTLTVKPTHGITSSEAE